MKEISDLLEILRTTHPEVSDEDESEAEVQKTQALPAEGTFSITSVLGRHFHPIINQILREENITAHSPTRR